MKTKNFTLDVAQDIEHKLTQKQLVSKLEDAIDKLLAEYNSTHVIPMNYHDIAHEIELIDGWKK